MEKQKKLERQCCLHLRATRIDHDDSEDPGRKLVNERTLALLEVDIVSSEFARFDQLLEDYGEPELGWMEEYARRAEVAEKAAARGEIVLPKRGRGDEI